MDVGVDRFEAILAELEVTPSQLRRDPTGRTWLSAEGMRLASEDPQCTAMLREFVEGELSFLGALHEHEDEHEFVAAPAPASDPFFTARVVQSLPQAWAPNRLSPRRRLVVLGLFHLIAGVLALMVLLMVPESTARWADQAHEMLRWGSDAGSGLWFGAMAFGAVALAAVFGGRMQSPTA